MIIRVEQFSALARVVEAEFAGRLALLLREQFEEARQIPSAELDEDIELLIPRAQAHGLTTEREVAAYAIGAFVLGENFDHEFPAAQRVLNSSVLNGADKVQWLEAWTTEMFRTLGQEELNVPR